MRLSRTLISCTAIYSILFGIPGTILGLIVTILSIYDYIIIDRLHDVPIAVGERDVDSVNKACEIYFDKNSGIYQSFDSNKFALDGFTTPVLKEKFDHCTPIGDTIKPSVKPSIKPVCNCGLNCKCSVDCPCCQNNFSLRIKGR